MLEDFSVSGLRSPLLVGIDHSLNRGRNDLSPLMNGCRGFPRLLERHAHIDNDVEFCYQTRRFSAASCENWLAARVPCAKTLVVLLRTPPKQGGVITDAGAPEFFDIPI